MNNTRSAFTLLILLLTGLLCHAQIITTIAGNGIAGFTGDGGPATAAQLVEPRSVAVDNSGNVFIGDYGAAVVRKINGSGIISRVVGNGVFSYAGDGGPALDACLFDQVAMAVGPYDMVYIADATHMVVRKAHVGGNIITLAGSGAAGYLGDGGPAFASLINSPQGIAVHDVGNIYIADAMNHVIRKVDPSHTITTFAGTGVAGYSGDGGPAYLAQINKPGAIAVDGSGNLYIADENWVVRKVDIAGSVISTIAGNGTPGYSGDGGPATAASISRIRGLCVDVSGNLYMADENYHVVRKVDTFGIITTFAGNGVGGGLGPASGTYSGDGGRADSAGLNEPSGLATDFIGNIYIADRANKVIRKVSGISSGYTHICLGDSVSFHAAAAGGVWSSSAPGVATVGATSGVVTGIAPGFANISYTIGTYSADIMVYVAAAPSAGIIAGLDADSICVGSVVYLTNSIPGGMWHLTNTNAYNAGGTITAAAGGRDTVLYRVDYTCGSATAQFVFTIVDPDEGIISGADTICVGDTVTFIESALGGIWSLTDSTIAAIIAPGIVSALVPGLNKLDYTVTSALAGCIGVASHKFYIDSAGHCESSGIAAIATTGLALVYPNPSTGTVHIEMSALNWVRTITVADIYGRTVLSAIVPPNEDQKELKLHVVPGTYILHIPGSDGIEARKIIVK